MSLFIRTKRLNENNIEEYLDVIKNNLVQREKTIQRLEKELNEVRSEKYEAEELKKMKDETLVLRKRLNRSFLISEQEDFAIKEWKKEHDVQRHNNPNSYHGCSGGGYTYSFFPTAIGTIASCRCDLCHKLALDASYREADPKKYHELMHKWNAELIFQDIT